MSRISPLLSGDTERHVIDHIRSIVHNDLHPIAAHIDQDGLYPRDVIVKLGKAGAFAQHHEEHGLAKPVDLGLAIRLMSLVSEECLSTAFCVWCQDTFGWYLQNTENSSLRARFQARVADGDLLSGTGFSNPIKALAGIEELRLHAVRVAGGYRVNGVLPWVSNLQDGHRFAIAFSIENEDRWAAAVVELGSAGVSGKLAAHFLALDGTSTQAVTFSDAFIPDADILAEELRVFVKRVRAGFVLLQAGMAIGLIRNCISLMRAMRDKHIVTDSYLTFGPKEAEERFVRLENELLHLAKSPLETETDFIKRVLAARLEASELSLASTQSLMLHAGARGYLLHSLYARKLRESYFVALVTPAIKHLRRDLAQLS